MYLDCDHWHLSIWVCRRFLFCRRKRSDDFCVFCLKLEVGYKEVAGKALNLQSAVLVCGPPGCAFGVDDIGNAGASSKTPCSPDWSRSPDAPGPESSAGVWTRTNPQGFEGPVGRGSRELPTDRPDHVFGRLLRQRPNLDPVWGVA